MQEFKDGKPNVLQYFTAQKLERLMDFVLVDHKKLEEKRVAYKFPLTAAEILSTPVARIYEFFGSTDEAGNMAYFEQLFSCIVDETGASVREEINFTRAGYVNKIVSNLISYKPQLFCDYVFKKPAITTALVKHSYCKSISALLLSLLTLPAQDPNAANLGISDITPNSSTVSGSWAKDVLAARLAVFKLAVDEAIEISHLRDHSDASNNLCNLAISVLSKDQPEKDDYLRTFLSNQLDTVVDLFTENYHAGVNNRLGNIFLVVLDILIKENDKQKYVEPAKLVTYFQKYAALIAGNPKQAKSSHVRGRSISTFSAELTKTNINIYKVLEALYMLIRYFASTGKEWIVIESELHKRIFAYYVNYAYNNVLHNQLQKILSFAVETSNKKLINAFFVDNPAFYDFLGNLLLATKDADSMRKSRKGYFGHAKALANSLIVYETKTGAPINSKLSRRSVAAVPRQLPHGREHEGESGAG